MKAILALTLLALAGFTLAACGSSGKVAGGPGAATFTGPITTTIADVQTGDRFGCDGMAGAEVPPPGHGVTANADGPSSKSSTLQLKRLADGSLVVSCTP